MNDIYREHILDHYANPRNQGTLEDADIVADADNPSCGDQVRIEVALDDAGRVERVAFEGEGCIVSMASASMFTEYVMGKSLQELEQLTDEEILENLDAPVGPRRRCALLPLQTLQAGVKAHRETAEA
jgi:nitrogen fixation NifU-like protein